MINPSTLDLMQDLRNRFVKAIDERKVTLNQTRGTSIFYEIAIHNQIKEMKADLAVIDAALEDLHRLKDLEK